MTQCVIWKYLCIVNDNFYIKWSAYLHNHKLQTKQAMEKLQNNIIINKAEKIQFAEIGA